MSTFSITVLTQLVALCVGPAEGAAPPPRLPQLAGSKDVIWAIRTRKSEEPGGQLEISYCPRVGERMLFRPLSVGRLRGKVVRSAAYEDALHVFFESGGHYQFEIPKRGQTTQTWAPQLQLPGATIPLALTGDEADACLYALVDGKTAGRLIKTGQGETQDIETPEDHQELVDERQAAIASAAVVLVQYRNRAWSVVDALPESVSGDQPMRLAAHGGQVFVLAGNGRDGDVIWVQWRKRSGFDVAPIDDLSIDRVVGMMVIDKSPVLVVQIADEKGSGAGYVPWVRTDGTWDSGSPISVDGQPLSRAADTIRFDRFGSRIVAMWTASDQGVVAGAWDVSGGDARIKPESIAILSLSPNAPQSEQLRVLIGAVALVALLFIVFVRRRESFLVDLPTPPGYELASFHRRLIAFTIDAFLVQMVAYPVVLAPWFAAHIDMTADFAEMSEQFQLTLLTDGQEFFWRWMAASAMFVVYGAVCEGLFAATVGKLIMGLRICSDEGKSCTLGAIMTRNVLRFVELYPAMQFAPTVIFVIMTRNRQRIGDLIARTIVVERSNTSPAHQTPSGEKNEPNDRESNVH